MSGRTFTMSDRAGTPPVIVVNQELARRFWPEEEAVGKVIRIGQAAIRVIGVVGDVRQRGLSQSIRRCICTCSSSSACV
jgi:putative ABC transport system permease protein